MILVLCVTCYCFVNINDEGKDEPTDDMAPLLFNNPEMNLENKLDELEEVEVSDEPWEAGADDYWLLFLCSAHSQLNLRFIINRLWLIENYKYSVELLANNKLFKG